MYQAYIPAPVGGGNGITPQVGQVYDPRASVGVVGRSAGPGVDWGAVLRQAQQPAAPAVSYGGASNYTPHPITTVQGGKLDLDAMAEKVGGKSGPSPEITVGPVWNDQQVDQRVNQMRANADRSTATGVRGMQQSVAGRGFGGNSPLAQAMQAQMQAGNLANKAGQENDIRWGAAQGNRDMVFKTQMGRENQFANRMAEDIERRRNKASVWGMALGKLYG